MIGAMLYAVEHAGSRVLEVSAIRPFDLAGKWERELISETNAGSGARTPPVRRPG